MSDHEQYVYAFEEISLPRWIRFCLLLTFQIPSLACGFFIICCFLIDADLRRSVKNHTIFILNLMAMLFVIIDVSLYLNFVRTGSVKPATPAHCIIWWYADIGIYYMCCLFTAWAAIERHLLVFNARWLSTTLGRCIGHHIPLISLLVYGFTFYTWMMIFPPCEHIYNYHLPVCGANPCYFQHPIIGLWEFGFNACATSMIVVVFSAALFFRVFIHKRALRQPLQWRKHRKMTFQLLSISTVATVFNMPLTVMFLAHLLGLPSEAGVELQLYFFFLAYWLPLSTPFVCLHSLPTVQEKMRTFVCLNRRYMKTSPMTFTQQASRP